MSTNNSTLGLILPERDSSVSATIDFSKAALEEWAHELPMSDTGACSKSLYNALKELNAIDLPLQDRFEAMEILKVSVHTVLLSLKKLFYDQHHSLTRKQIAVSQLAVAMNNEMVLAYKDLLDQIASNKAHLKTNKPMAATCAFRCINISKNILQIKYILYEAPPENLWAEIYKVYEFVKENKLDDVEILNSVEKISTPYQAFVRTVLLAATNPFQWRQIEQNVIARATDEWLDQVLISDYTDSCKSEPGMYVIHLDSDLPPCPASISEPRDTKKSIVLNTSKITLFLGKVLNELEAGELRARLKHEKEPSYSLHIPTIQKLFNNWSNCLTRTHTRFEIGGKMTIAIGVPAAHYHISGKKAFSHDANNTNSTESSGESLSLDTSELPTFEIEEIGNEGGDNSSKISDEEIEEKDEFAHFHCETINVSPTGSCLKWLTDSHPDIEPGEVICMRNPDADGEQWSIGVIRWLKHNEENNLRIGIQLLGPYAKPAGIQLVKDDEAASCFLRCLILPEVESLNMKRTIITPPLPFKEGSTINIRMGDEEVIRSALTIQSDQTSYYKQFEYKSDKSQAVIDEALQKQSQSHGVDVEDSNISEEQTASASDSGSDSFDSIWDDL